MALSPAIIDTLASKRFILVRKHLKLNQTEMALACSISQSAVAKIEAGNLDIPREVIKILYLKFNISPIYMVVGDAPMVYKKPAVSSLVKNIPEMQADIEILKSQVKILTNFINDTKTRNAQ